MIFLNSASSAAALVFYLPGVCTHTDTEGKQRQTRVRNILKSSKKNTIFNAHPLPYKWYVSMFMDWICIFPTSKSNLNTYTNKKYALCLVKNWIISKLIFKDEDWETNYQMISLNNWKVHIVLHLWLLQMKRLQEKICSQDPS